jgi:hypothetical protein
MRALYFLRDPSGRCLRLYVHMRSRYLVLGGRLILGMNSKVFMSIKPSIYGSCASVNTSGKAGAQIPQLPLGDDSSPWGDNAVCT